MNDYDIVHLVIAKVTLFPQGSIVLFNFMSKFLMQYSVEFFFPIGVLEGCVAHIYV
jgi:hypothetical protein